MSCLTLLISCTAMLTAANPEGSAAMQKDYTVVSFYFPNYHPDARNQARKGKGWTEWELVKNAKPKFPGHKQPKVPMWGYTDESDPNMMAQKIDAAVDHGVDVFMFDWYYYNDGLFLERGVEQGFMKAPNAARMKFALMWANHDWQDIHPATVKHPGELLYPGTVAPETFERMTSYVIETYFKHPSYWKIDGCPVFSIYEMHTLMKSFGGVDATAAALQRFRDKVKAAGFPSLHLNAISWGIQILPTEKTVKNIEELVKRLAFDSVTSYVWVHDMPLPDAPVTQYKPLMEKAVEVWNQKVKQFTVPYFPNVSTGWDSSPRCTQTDPWGNTGYPFTNCIGGNTPEAFQEALQKVKAFLDAHPECHNTFTINCWNEWTEGSYLEPDTENGFGYLEAIQKVFGKK